MTTLPPFGHRGVAVSLGAGAGWFIGGPQAVRHGLLSTKPPTSPDVGQPRGRLSRDRRRRVRPARFGRDQQPTGPGPRSSHGQRHQRGDHVVHRLGDRRGLRASRPTRRSCSRPCSATCASPTGRPTACSWRATSPPTACPPRPAGSGSYSTAGASWAKTTSWPAATMTAPGPARSGTPAPWCPARPTTTTAGATCSPTASSSSSHTRWAACASSAWTPPCWTPRAAR
jgi:hypothetical protein